MEDVAARWLAGGGGSWDYAADGDGTLWTQTNTLILRPRLLGPVLGPFVARSLRRSTRTAMARAKAILEEPAPS